MRTKQTVRQILDRLPDDCTIEDVLYHLYVINAVERGRADAETGKTISQEQVVEELRKRWLVGDAG
jgi:predicted transcriptional regulator